MWRQKRLAFAVSALMATAVEAQDVDALATALSDHAAIPGATVGWVTADDQAWAVAGLRIAGTAEPVERDDLWHIGSLTKSMTATLAARLVANGEVTWDTPLASDGPSLAQLLTHRSGMRANPGFLVRLGMPADWDAPQTETRQRLIEAALRSRQR